MTANIKKSAQYQLFDLKNAVIIYYIVIVALQLASWIIAAIVRSNSPTAVVVGSSSGDMPTIFFLFVVGLCTFKENFGMLLQNGFSRRAVLCGRLVSFGLLACGMTVIDRLLALVFNAAGQAAGALENVTLFESLYGPRGFGWQMLGLLFTLLFYFVMLAIGYLISLLFYRLNKLGKILVGAGVPVLLMIVGPALDGLFTGGKIYAAAARFLATVFGLVNNQPWYAVATLAVTAALAALLCWLLLRRAVVRK